mgnify:CR=1 FL=1
MVLVSKTVAVNKKGELKKGFKKVDCSNGRVMFFSSEPPKNKKKVEQKETKPKKSKKKEEPKEEEPKEEELKVEM